MKQHHQQEYYRHPSTSMGQDREIKSRTGPRCFKRPPPDRRDQPTRHISIIGVSSSDDETVREACLSFGSVESIEPNVKNQGIRAVTYHNLFDAIAAHGNLADNLASELGRTVGVYFCELVLPPKYREELRCTSETASVVVPGLNLIDHFIGEDEERSLLQYFMEADKQRWTGPLKRRVKHYGRAFDYRTRHLDFNLPAPPLPDCLSSILRDIEERAWKLRRPDQLTLNEYTPGQGISPHVDTHSAFEDGLASLSLGSGCVMDMRHPRDGRVKSVYLPRGSLLVMEGPARYEWSHGIASRKTDMVDGTLMKRSTRLSLTFRCVRDPSVACDCDYEVSCDRSTPVPQATHLPAFV